MASMSPHESRMLQGISESLGMMSVSIHQLQGEARLTNRVKAKLGEIAGNVSLCQTIISSFFMSQVAATRGEVAPGPISGQGFPNWTTADWDTALDIYLKGSDGEKD